MSKVTYVAEALVVDREIGSPRFELETTPSREIVGPYGAYLATMAVPQPDFASGPAAWRQAMPVRSTTPLEHMLDALVLLPAAAWKRVALYSFLFLLFGNGLTCRGLSMCANMTCVALVVLGIAGLYACGQRNP
jgi:hypothetical protein